jgi:hypothetical protein
MRLCASPAVGISPAGQFGQAKELHARQPRGMGVRGIGADLPAAITLPDLRLAQPLAGLVAEDERRVGEQDGITVSGAGVRPADGLLRRRMSSQHPGSCRPGR